MKVFRNNEGKEVILTDKQFEDYRKYLTDKDTLEIPKNISEKDYWIIVDRI